ncbi:putative vacuolar morphogenesis protein 7 [Cercophora samala]|uniref:Vacuolar morphogenesis protein 7 n=1 Tax=Cercophora samala TaxID=330535 RepID=A0AA39Z9P5_9PEZI|nr:putative vacuolar morphogenesis protein 7 [Cercophora samala]
MAPPIEISIPTTSISTPANGKPFTLYNITLRLPLRSLIVQKRYSEFEALHKNLHSMVGAYPPEPLPEKSWWRTSTANSPERTEQRRAGLEKYLRAIAEPPDRRWRDTPVWRAFLGLPAGSSTQSASGISVEGRIPAIGLREANLAAASDPGTWLDLHRELKTSLHEARVALGRRDGALENSARVEAGSAAKRALIKAGNLIGSLSDGLRVMKEDGNKLGEGELRRRRDLLAAARVERDGLDKLSSSFAVAGGGVAAGAVGRHQGVASASERAALMGNSDGGPSSIGIVRSSTGRRVLGAPLPETERTRELDNEGVLQLQRDTMNEQDQEVEALAKIIRRQKEMGLAINDEVNRHIDMLDRLNDDVDVVGRKLGVAKDRVKRLDKASMDTVTTAPPLSERAVTIQEIEQEDNSTITTTNAVRQQQQQQQQQDQPGGGIIDAVLLLIVRGVLAGVQGYAVLEWLMGKISAALVWVVEVVLLLVQTGNNHHN